MMAKFKAGDKIKSKTTRWRAIVFERKGKHFWKVTKTSSGDVPAPGSVTEHSYCPEEDDEEMELDTQ